MNKRIEIELKVQGRDLEPIYEAEHLLGYDPARMIESGNMNALATRMRQEAHNADVTEGLKRTQAVIKCVMADYVIRQDLKQKTPKDAFRLGAEKEILRQMGILNPKAEQIWKD